MAHGLIGVSSSINDSTLILCFVKLQSVSSPSAADNVFKHWDLNSHYFFIRGECSSSGQMMIWDQLHVFGCLMSVCRVSLRLLRSDKTAQKTDAFFMHSLRRNSKNRNICGAIVSNRQTDHRSLEERSGSAFASCCRLPQNISSSRPSVCVQWCFYSGDKRVKRYRC